MAIGDVMALRTISVSPHETVQTAVARMLEEEVGAIAVCEGDELVGIFTEHDVLRLAGECARLAEIRVGEVMTRRPITVAPDDDVVSAAELMTEKRIRHLPVVHDGHFVGMVAIRDLLGSLVERLWRDHDPHARHAARRLLGRREEAIEA